MAAAEPKILLFSEADLYENTELINKMFVYQWSIKNFGTYLDRKYELSSRIFSNFQSGESKWKLMVYPKHVYPKGAMLTVSLMKMSENKISYGVKYKLWIVTNKGLKKMLIKEKMFKKYLDFDEDFLVSHKELINENLLQNGSLILRCEMNVLLLEIDNQNILYHCLPSTSNHDSMDLNHMTSSIVCDLPNDVNTKPSESKINIKQDQPKNISGESVITKLLKFSDLENCAYAVSKDMKKLYDRKIGADVVLLCGGIKVEAHKYILEDRSDYFRKLFCTENGERNNAIEIPHMYNLALERILYFMYTDVICDMPFNLAVDMLSSAKVFEMDYLHKRLMACLTKCINVENVIEIMLYCEELDQDELKQLCTRFISVHYSEVFKSETFQSLLKSNLIKANDIMLQVHKFSPDNF